MDNYPTNSNKSKEQSKRVHRVATGEVSKKPKSGVTKFSEIFLAEDFETAIKWVLQNKVVPSIQEAIEPAVHVLLHGTDTVETNNRYSSGPYVPYENKYRNQNNSSRYNNRSQRVSFDYRDICYSNWGEADRVLSELMRSIDDYGVVSVSDWYEASGVSCSYTYNNYGWTNLNDVRIVKATDNGGCYIKLPRPMEI